MAFYERMIDDGTADADRRGGAVDHITARRIAIWLAAHPQQPEFAQAHYIDGFRYPDTKFIAASPRNFAPALR